jgi:ribosomal protein L14E/L6E/L27E
MSDDKLQAGKFVKSVAGRDRGKTFLVFDVLNAAFVRVIDGNSRKIQNPKKKNVRHLRVIPVDAGEMAERLALGERVTDEEVSRAISALGSAGMSEDGRT